MNRSRLGQAPDRESGRSPPVLKGKPMRRTSVLTAVTATVALGIAPSASAASADTVPYLPHPTGRQPVGVTTLYLKDTSRSDPWVPSVRYRELMVSLFYPATSATGAKKQYMTPLESQRYLESQ